jgi:hypothetical protein
MDKPWQTQARDLHFTQGLPPSEVAVKVGYSLETVRKFLNQERKTLGPTMSKSARTFEGRKPISNRHASIGSRIARYRFNQPEAMTAGQLGSMLGTSRLRIREMELGFHDFTLTECDKISKLLDIPLAELIRA